jgi:hypothetical protein
MVKIKIGPARLPQKWLHLLKFSPPPPGLSGNQPKPSQHFWVKLAENHPTKIRFIKDQLPDGIISHQQQ